MDPKLLIREPTGELLYASNPTGRTCRLWPANALGFAPEVASVPNGKAVEGAYEVGQG